MTKIYVTLSKMMACIKNTCTYILAKEIKIKEFDYYLGYPQNLKIVRDIKKKVKCTVNFFFLINFL